MGDRWLDRHERTVTRTLQLGLAAILLWGLVRLDAGVAVNAAVALAITFLPALLRRDYQVALDPLLAVWLTGAVFLHAVGMVGPYGTTWWWDHLTHVLSAGLVAAVGYTVTRAFDEHLPELYLPEPFLYVFVFLFTVAAGVAWELLEFLARWLADTTAAAPVLVQYSFEDTMLDLVFDMVGAVLVTALAVHRLQGVVATVEAALARSRPEE
ncbi:MAG: hypothetical protein ABEJ31_01000 [Haloarculaceae archaeon]